MQFFVITAFPDMFPAVWNESILKRAQEKALAQFEVYDLRSFSSDKHKTIDDYAFGGGPGMILKPEPIFKCVEHIIQKHQLDNPRIILTSAAGRQFDQAYANEFIERPERASIFICGHYKGVDERIRTALATEEISLGDFILTGGEIVTMAIIDAVVRLIPGVIGDFESAEGDAFQSGTLDHPHYTRPQEFRGMAVPEVLLSGHHGKIAEWRHEAALKLTREKRPDLLKTKEHKQ